MEIKITINVEGVDPIEVKVDVPEKCECSCKEVRPNVGQDSAWFDETSTAWTKNAELNKVFLIQQQDFCNEKLRARGYLFENDVRDSLGLPRTKRGQRFGWVWDNERNQATVVDFGIFADYNRNFINGLDDKVLLDFNVDGDILQYL